MTDIFFPREIFPPLCFVVMTEEISSPTQKGLADLPQETLGHFFTFLEPTQWHQLREVSHLWRRIVSEHTASLQCWSLSDSLLAYLASEFPLLLNLKSCNTQVLPKISISLTNEVIKQWCLPLSKSRSITVLQPSCEWT